MKILIVGIQWPPETFLERLIQELLTLKVQVTVASHSRPEKKWLEASFFKWLPLPSWNKTAKPFRILLFVFLFFRALALSPKQLERFYKECQKKRGFLNQLRLLYQLMPFIGRKWDAVYFPWNLSALQYEGLFAMGIPTVISCRGSQIHIAPHNPERKLREGLERTFSKAQAIHCVSQAIFKEAQNYGLDAEKASVFSPAVDMDFFIPKKEVRKKDGIVRIVSVGNLDWRKGYEYALMAIRSLADKKMPIDFSILGEGPGREQIQYTVEDLNLREKVHLKGRLAKSQLLEHLQQADLFLFPSLSEGISNAVLEAMACELPVVAYQVGGLPEVIRHEETGFLIPVRNVEAMSTALEKLVGDNLLREQVGKAARQFLVSQNWSPHRQASRFLTLFQSVSNERRASHV